MSFMQDALRLAEKGFYVFPLIEGTKEPLVAFKEKASRDPAAIRRMWLDPVLGIEQPYNVGIYTGRFGESDALLVVDVDNKGDKNGDQELLRLEREGLALPSTLEQKTPSGGRHLIYRVPQPVKQGANVLGRGIDIRSRGGYVVGAGSRTQAGAYVADDLEIAEAPEWLVERCGRGSEREEVTAAAPADLDQERARRRAIHYLTTDAQFAVEGDAGDHITFSVAARIKDFGVPEEEAFELLAEYWNPECIPPWPLSDLRQKVKNAYRYGSEPVGVDAPEAEFDVVEEESKDQAVPLPFLELNKEYAFVLAGGGSRILWETRDAEGQPKVEHLSPQAFHQKLAAQTMRAADGNMKPVSLMWMKSPHRRSYDGIVFDPSGKADPRFYNLWRGFSVEPASREETPSREAKASLDAFLSHARTNVCQNDEALYHWLIGYFAHMIQKPEEKPLVALVFRGSKGVGKNALIDRVGHLLGNHYLLASNSRYLMGNFNSHLENLLMFALDEAFWSGDKHLEGVLKDLITGKKYIIEHKGKEPYTVDNRTRIVIIGNEEWLVPASQDERRFAVFDVGEGRKQDRSFFQTMREGMERGGYRLLLRFLLDYDLKGVDVNDAPKTQALLEQKISSSQPLEQWWLNSLEEGRIIASDFGGVWPEEIGKERLREAFRRYVKERQIRAWLTDDRSFGRALKRICPSLDSDHKRREGDNYIRVYRMPTLEQARQEWEQYLGQRYNWPDAL